VPGLCEVADFIHKLSIEAPTSKIAQIFNRSRFLAISQNPCYA